jgi:hypothetical protein
MSWRQVWVLAGVIAIALTAFAIGKGAKSNTVVLCADKQGGDLTLASHGKCDNGSKSLKIAKRGPTGPAGPAGAQGPAGQAGENGQDGQDGSAASVQPEAPHLIGTGASTCQTSPGTYCGPDGAPCTAWKNAGGASAPGTYLKDAEGFVHVSGTATDTNGGGACPGINPMLYLPPGYRPVGGTLRFEVTDCNGARASVSVSVAGQIYPAPYNSCISLDGISFRAGV